MTDRVKWAERSRQTKYFSKQQNETGYFCGMTLQCASYMIWHIKCSKDVGQLPMFSTFI